MSDECCLLSCRPHLFALQQLHLVQSDSSHRVLPVPRLLLLLSSTSCDCSCNCTCACACTCTCSCSGKQAEAIPASGHQHGPPFTPSLALSPCACSIGVELGGGGLSQSAYTVEDELMCDELTSTMLYLYRLAYVDVSQLEDSRPL